MSSPEEPPTKPTATNGDAADERGTPQPAGGQGAAKAKPDADRPGGGQPGQPAGAAQPGTSAQPSDQRSTGQSAADPQRDAGSDQPSASDDQQEQPAGTAQPATSPQPNDQQGTGQSGAGSEQQSAGQTEADAGQSGAGGADGESAIPQLSPIPPGGTSAPVDSDRVFGRTGQPFAGAPTPAEPGSGWQRSPSSQAEPVAQPTEADLKKIRSFGRWALAFGIIGLLTLLVPPFGLILGIAAIVVGVMGRRLARRKSVFSPGAVPGIVLGIVSTMISAVIAVSLAVFWTETRTYMTCLEGANTHSAQTKCVDEFKESLEKRGLVTEPQ
ncbi:DUF4190 domain-containing protein [Flindersiella endophytica]